MRLLLLTALLLAPNPQNVHSRDRAVPTLKEEAVIAKERGLSRVVHRIFYEQIDGSSIHLKDLLKTHSFLVVEPRATTLQVTETDIYTWYKLQVVQVLSSPSACTECIENIDVPETLPPLQSDEVALRVLRGEANIDGVAMVYVNPSEPTFVPMRRYLIVASVPKFGSVIDISAGAATVFEVDGEGRLVVHGPNASALSEELGKLHTLKGLEEAIPALLNRVP